MAKVMEVPEEEFAAMLRDTFQRFDDDGSGTLELDEIVRAFEMLPLKEISEDEVRAKFTRFDEDKSGALDFDEFSDLMRELRKESAVKSDKKRPRLDNVERKSVRNIVNMAEVQLTRLPAEEREAAMAQILAFANSGEVVIKTAPRDEGSRRRRRKNARERGERELRPPPPSRPRRREASAVSRGRLPRARPSAADSPRDEWHRGDDAAARTSASSSSLPPLAPGRRRRHRFRARGGAAAALRRPRRGGLVAFRDALGVKLGRDRRRRRSHRAAVPVGGSVGSRREPWRRREHEYLAERLGAMSACGGTRWCRSWTCSRTRSRSGRASPRRGCWESSARSRRSPGASRIARGGGGRGASSEGGAGVGGRGGGRARRGFRGRGGDADAAGIDADVKHQRRRGG